MRFLPVLLLSTLLCLTISAVAQEKADEEAAEATERVASYINLAPSLISNLHGVTRFIRTDVQLLTYDEDNIEAIELHAPALRHALLSLFSDQKRKAVQTAKGKESLRQKSLQAVQEMMKSLTGEERVDDLFFTTYYVE